MERKKIVYYAEYYRLVTKTYLFVNGEIAEVRVCNQSCAQLRDNTIFRHCTT